MRVRVRAIAHSLACWGRHVNFITGANGSGKSAIVAAIQLCLGSSAKRTGRGTNLASLIRDGAQSGAVLRVKLINEGDEVLLSVLFMLRTACVLT